MPLALIKRLYLSQKNRVSAGAAHARRSGDAARDAKQWDTAARFYQDYLAEQSNHAAIWVQLGHMLKEGDHLTDARHAYENAIALEPDDADAHLYYGHLLKRQNNLADAVQAYRKSFAIDANSFAAEELASAEVQRYLVGHASGAPAGSFRRGRDVGSIDRIEGSAVHGWAIDPDHPTRPAEIEFSTASHVVGGAVSNRFRADIAALGFGTPTAGFVAELNLDRRDRSKVLVHAYLKSTGEELSQSPFEASGFSPTVDLTDGPPVTSARFAIAKRFRGRTDGEVAVFVTHSPYGVLKAHVAPYVKALRENGIEVLLVVVADRPVRLSKAQLDIVSGAMVRENVGYDFAAWGHAVRLHPKMFQATILYFVNDSMFGPNDPDLFQTMLTRLRASDADFVGLTESYENGWHIQSYFMAMKRPVLENLAVQKFFGQMVNLPGKQAVIDAYETTLAPLIESHGFKTEVLFPSPHPMNPTLFSWRELIDSKFPFVKTLLFRGETYLFDISNWERDLLYRGFDVALLKDVLRQHDAFGPVEPGFPLLAMPADTDIDPDEPLKVAFYGPWNFDNGLGSASRGIVAALRTTGVRVNLCPLKKPFHVHRELAPPFDICDFEGPADIAIVHLNPDSWPLLTDDQRREIGAARKRIGYWVWEMAHLPKAWHAEFSSVDRIWAPSGYCAELFDEQNAAPVDVIPHAVPLPETVASNGEREALLASFGLAADRRVILYVFDGASYLVRKNPHALVRAFSASGLAARGWTLVLKTKNLMDRPADGQAFADLVGTADDIVLINRAMPDNDLRLLIDVADIYASPHCSEGFGLTIAEAMAAGKSVVATDFSGSTEFLDASCGYPVEATPWRLDEDFGHYTKGGEWARIDEIALKNALKRAADAIEAGDHSMGRAAQRRIASQLSYQAIGERISASLIATLNDTAPQWPAPPSLTSKLLSGHTVEDAKLGDAVHIAPLKPGTMIPAVSDELKRVADRPDRWLMLVPADARIDPDFLQRFQTHAENRGSVAIFYADDVAVKEAGLNGQLRLKPEFDLTLFLAQDYIGAPLIVRGSALHALGGIRHELGAAALTDLVLRAWAQGLPSARIPFVLSGQPGVRPSVPAELRRSIFAAHPALRDYDLLPGLTPQTLQLARRFDAETMPAVTLLVPTRRSVMPDGTQFIARLLDSLAETDWPMDRLHVLVADDIPGEPDWLSRRPYQLRRIETPRAENEPFNYAAKMNLLWRAAETDHLVMLNDDVNADDGAWLKALMTFAIDEDVGAVGPLLRYEDGSVQHAGVVGGLFGVCAHAWLHRRSPTGTYQDWALTHREWSMVTGAVMATRKAMMERVNGFDEQFALEFNDLDLCLRMRATGARIVYTPHAQMTHAEKASRGSVAPPAEDTALFLRRWKRWLAEDPAFHPKLDHDRFDLTPTFSDRDWFAS